MMKPSTKLKRARVHHDKAMSLINSLNDKLVKLLDDDCAHVSFSTDGLVIVYSGGRDNSAIAFLDIDEFLELTDKEEALKILDQAAI